MTPTVCVFMYRCGFYVVSYSNIMHKILILKFYIKFCYLLNFVTIKVTMLSYSMCNVSIPDN